MDGRYLPHNADKRLVDSGFGRGHVVEGGFWTVNISLAILTRY